MSKKRSPYSWLVPAGVVLVLAVISAAYLHEAVWGGKGYLKLLERQQEIQRLEEELASVQAQRDRLQDRVRRLHEETLDLDLLDERVRAVLGYARPDEQILIVQDPPN